MREWNKARDAVTKRYGVQRRIRMNQEKELYMRKVSLKIRLLLLIPCLLFVAGASRAQSFVMSLPGPSQRAEVEQRIGLTDVTIKYHRPLVNSREVWGKLVPYGSLGAQVRTRTRR